jgi:hypothetical protein
MQVRRCRWYCIMLVLHMLVLHHADPFVTGFSLLILVGGYIRRRSRSCPHGAG